MMREFKRVRHRVLWQDVSFRMVRYLVIYCHGDGSWEAPYWSEPIMYWEVQECSLRSPTTSSYGDWITLWAVSRIPGWYRDDYLYADRAERARITRRNAQLGRQWLDRHRRLITSPPFQIKCDSVDGEGTPCPLTFNRDGRCFVTSWFLHGYAGSPGGRQCPGICDMPARQTNIPLAYDKFGCSLASVRCVNDAFR